MKISVLGLGIMGAGMARQLIAKGFTVAVWNRDAAKAVPLAAAGARAARSVADATRDADVVLAMLANDEASRSVWLGEAGALAAMRQGAIAIESSTLTVEWIRELSATAQTRGFGFLDAPVTGSKMQAESGALSFLVGGPAELLERVRPVLAAMGGSIAHLGPTGSGAMMKLINNFLCGVQVASLAEAIAMAERSGLDARQAAAVLGAGSPGSPLVKIVAQRMLDRAYEPNFFVPLMAKDLSYARQAFALAGIELKSADAARDRFAAAEKAGFAEKDIASIVELLRR
ncbi:MAG TPA: NAD(P)-dependent oxidoreductase [Steroidobacteraceae bacterium]|nr:NAD(P)-dependent oxidoreductase [Steroidobacteraceae bacterium]